MRAALICFCYVQIPDRYDKIHRKKITTQEILFDFNFASKKLMALQTDKQKPWYFLVVFETVNYTLVDTRAL